MNPFQILGLQPPVTVGAAKARYRELVKTHHPDRGGDPATFRRIQEAWEALKTARPVRRPPRSRPAPVVITITFSQHQGGITFTTQTASGNW